MIRASTQGVGEASHNARAATNESSSCGENEEDTSSSEGDGGSYADEDDEGDVARDKEESDMDEELRIELILVLKVKTT
ncbi:hypothetical protein JCGZ_13506 [Jatropha curcas]|uniref:Uncharacterized protein n=1 Tax=Jatropha curcas TaxID=180498 RepID=A0A067KN76_JATCU|nr:hypothetical protein JCGZ_13506 [Jatropha curcas]